MKAYIVFKIDDIYVLQIKNLKVRLYKMNPRSEEKLVIPEAYSYFKELFEEKQVKYALSEYQDQDYKIKLKSGS